MNELHARPESHVAHDRLPQRSNRIRERRTKTKRELFGDGTAAGHGAPLENGDFVASFCEIKRGSKSVVPGSYDDDRTHRFPSFKMRIAAFRPGAPMIPPPGCVADPHM